MSFDSFVFDTCISIFININYTKSFRFIILIHAYRELSPYLPPPLLTSLPLHLLTNSTSIICISFFSFYLWIPQIRTSKSHLALWISLNLFKVLAFVVSHRSVRKLPTKTWWRTRNDTWAFSSVSISTWANVTPRDTLPDTWKLCCASVFLLSLTSTFPLWRHCTGNCFYLLLSHNDNQSSSAHELHYWW